MVNPTRILPMVHAAALAARVVLLLGVDHVLHLGDDLVLDVLKYSKVTVHHETQRISVDTQITQNQVDLIYHLLRGLRVLFHSAENLF